jgi:DNA polymerase V
LTDKHDIKEAVSNYASNVALKLRNENRCAKELHVFIQTNPFKNEDRQYFRSVNMEMPVATQAANELIKYALKAVDMIYSAGYKYLKVGVIALNLVPETEIQSGLFDKEKRATNTVVMKTIDKTNKLFGKDMIRFACQGYEKDWKLRAAYLSARYTTNVNELLTIKI